MSFFSYLREDALMVCRRVVKENIGDMMDVPGRQVYAACWNTKNRTIGLLKDQSLLNSIAHVGSIRHF